MYENCSGRDRDGKCQPDWDENPRALPGRDGFSRAGPGGPNADPRFKSPVSEANIWVSICVDFFASQSCIPEIVVVNFVDVTAAVRARSTVEVMPMGPVVPFHISMI